uniref:Inwardly rectifying k+ channel n=1 Tax=Macrostomum lignano TaxID=282301 RepID=A0A1I8IT79_9PLAT
EVEGTAPVGYQISTISRALEKQLKIAGRDADIPAVRNNLQTVARRQEFVQWLTTNTVMEREYPKRKSSTHPDRVGKRRRYKRLLFKNGDMNITQCSVKDRRRRYLADIFTTLIDSKWTYAVLLFVAVFVLSWLIGGLIWLLVAFSRQDTIPEKADSARCVYGVSSFITAFQFSLETQHTIGYGTPRTANSFCPEVVLFVMLQSVVGVLIQAFMTGFIFSKLTLPGKRAGAIMFSREALVTKRDDQMVLLIRVGDMRRSQLMEASIKGTLVRKRITRENEILPLEQFRVDFRRLHRDRLFLPFPAIVEHRIDEKSPFWDISADDLQHEQFELVVALAGVAESTGSTAEARTSYLPSEIRWGYNFERLVTYQKENGRYQIDFNKFNSTRPTPLFPRMSARQMAGLCEANLRLFDAPAAAGSRISAIDETQTPSNQLRIRYSGSYIEPGGQAAQDVSSVQQQQDQSGPAVRPAATASGSSREAAAACRHRVAAAGEAAPQRRRPPDGYKYKCTAQQHAAKQQHPAHYEFVQAERCECRRVAVLSEPNTAIEQAIKLSAVMVTSTIRLLNPCRIFIGRSTLTIRSSCVGPLSISAAQLTPHTLPTNILADAVNGGGRRSRQTTTISDAKLTNIPTTQTRGNSQTKVYTNADWAGVKGLLMFENGGIMTGSLSIERLCSKCGGGHNSRTRCPAEGKMCHVCDRANHFGRVCRSQGAKVAEVVDDSDHAAYTVCGAASPDIRCRLKVQGNLAESAQSSETASTKKLIAYNGEAIGVVGEAVLSVNYRDQQVPFFCFTVVQQGSDIMGADLMQHFSFQVVDRDGDLLRTLDLNSSYLQLELVEDRRDLTAFITEKGLYRYKRVCYGRNGAPAAFQKVLSKILHGGLGTLHYIDDIVVHAANETEHRRRLTAVLDRLLAHGVTLNTAKCQWATESADRLLAYEFQVCHVPGKKNVVPDILSRDGAFGEDCAEDPTEHQVNAVLLLGALEVVSASELAEASLKDPVINEVITLSLQGWPSSIKHLRSELQPFWRIRMQLTAWNDGKCLANGTRAETPPTFMVSDWVRVKRPFARGKLSSRLSESREISRIASATTVILNDGSRWHVDNCVRVPRPAGALPHWPATASSAAATPAAAAAAAAEAAEPARPQQPAQTAMLSEVVTEPTVQQQPPRLHSPPRWPRRRTGRRRSSSEEEIEMAAALAGWGDSSYDYSDEDEDDFDEAQETGAWISDSAVDGEAAESELSNGFS